MELSGPPQAPGASAVTTVYGRTGAVVATAGDYNAGQIINTPSGSIVATDVQAAINELDTFKVNRAGDTISGALSILGSADQTQFSIQADVLQTANLVEFRDSGAVLVASVSSDGTVSAPTDLTTKSYVDAAIVGMTNDSLQDADANTLIQTEEGANDDTIRFDTAGSERMLISATGNVGINKPVPQTKLDINGTLKIADGGETCTVGANAGMIRYNAGNLDYCNGSAWVTLGVSGAGLINLNGQTGGTQSFAVGAAGTSHAFSSAGDVHTLSIPLASGVGVTSGTISKADYDIFNNKLDSIVGETLNSAQFWLGSAGNMATAVSMSGDATMSNTGALTIAASSISTAKIQDDSVTSVKIANDSIVDGDINAVAAINATKLANGLVDNTEFGYLNGVTSSIQTQIDAKENALGYLPLNKAGDTMTGSLIIGNSSEFRLLDGGGANHVGFRAPGSVATSVVWTLPPLDGIPGQVLQTDGAGYLSWIDSGDFRADGSVQMFGPLNMGSQDINNAAVINALDIYSNSIGLPAGTAASPTLTVGGAAAGIFSPV